MMGRIVFVHLELIMIILPVRFVTNKIVFSVAKTCALHVIQVSTCLIINAKNVSPIVKYVINH